MKKALLILLAMIVCLTVGYFIGRLSIDTELKIDHIKGATISGSVSPTQFKPIKEEKPDIQYRDTGSIKYINVSADTAAIIADWELKRTYQLTAFDNDKGKLELFPTIQFNRLSALDYNFTPMIERQTINKTKVWQPFLSGSYSTLGYIGIGGGVFYHNLGLEYQHQMSLDKDGSGHLFGVLWKF